MAEPSEPGQTAAFASRRVVFGLPAIMLLAAIGIECARIGLSGLIVELAQSDFDVRSRSGIAASPTELDRVAARFSDGLRFHSGNPWALEGLALANFARMRASRVPTEAVAHSRESYRRIREALVQRPTSPYLWSNLALAKLYLDEIDDEFLAAVRHADDLGPWEPATQELVLFASLAAWESLDAPMRGSAKRVLERASNRNAEKMLEIVRRFRRLDLLCPLNGYHSIAARDCAKKAGGGR